MSAEESEVQKGGVLVQWSVTLIMNTCMLTYGFQAGWISPMTKYLQSPSSPTGPLSVTDISWVASIVCVAAAASVPFYVFLADRYGRRISVLAIAVPQMACWITKILATSTWMLILARVFGGISAGGCFNIIPMYTREIAQDNIRGTLGSLMVLSQNFGYLIMYFLGVYLDYYTVLWTVAWVPVLTFLLMLKAPESPAFLVKKERIEEAASTLALLRGLSIDDKSIQAEINDMKSTEAYFRTIPALTFGSIFNNKAWCYAFILSTVLISVQALNGAFAILTYASAILASAGVSFSPDVQSLCVPIVTVIGSAVSIVTVDRVGRKPCLAAAFILTAISMAGIATIMLLGDQGVRVPAWCPIVSMVIPVFAYAVGIIPLIYIVMAEITNFQVRAKVIGVGTALAWLISFVQLLAYGPVSEVVGKHVTFYVFALVNLCGGIVVLVFQPETRGKSVEQIEEELRRNKKN